MALKILSGFDDDIARETHQKRHQAIHSFHLHLPQPGACFRWQHTYPHSGTGLTNPWQRPVSTKKAGQTRGLALFIQETHHNADVLVDSIFVALTAQTITVSEKPRQLHLLSSSWQLTLKHRRPSAIISPARLRVCRRIFLLPGSWIEYSGDRPS